LIRQISGSYLMLSCVHYSDGRWVVNVSIPNALGTRLGKIKYLGIFNTAGMHSLVSSF
jgi:hypothetical protein